MTAASKHSAVTFLWDNDDYTSVIMIFSLSVQNTHVGLLKHRLEPSVSENYTGS